MSLVIGNRLRRSACTIYPKHSCRNVAESQSSHRGKRRQIVAAQPGTQLISFASSAGSTTPAACGAVPEKGHLWFLVPLLLSVAKPAAFLTEGYLTSLLAVCWRFRWPAAKKESSSPGQVHFWHYPERGRAATHLAITQPTAAHFSLNLPQGQMVWLPVNNCPSPLPMPEFQPGS